MTVFIYVATLMLFTVVPAKKKVSRCADCGGGVD